MPCLIIFILGAIFFSLGFILTEKNAKHLLAGYNTMSKEKQAKADIAAYVRFFRRFHLFLGVSFVLLSWAGKPLLPEGWHGGFVVLYPCLAYVYLAAMGSRFMKT